MVWKPADESEAAVWRESLAALSERERRLVELLVPGRSTEEIARSLLMGTETVDWSVAKLCRKLGVGSRTELEERLQAAFPAPSQRRPSKKEIE